MSYNSMGRVDPGIDISHYGAPYRGMFGLDGVGRYVDRPGFHAEYATAGLGMLYRYRGMRGLGSWTGKPSEDPRMVKRFTTIKATWRAQNLPSGGAAEAAQRLYYQGTQLFRGNTVRKIGGTGWIAGGRVGYEVILANSMRAGEIKSKNFQAGQRAQSGMGGNVRFTDPRTSIPANGFTESGTDAPATPEETPSATLSEQTAAQSPFTRQVAGLPAWAWGAIGIGAIGVVATVALSGKPRRAAPAVTPNRRRRRRRRRSSRRRRR